MVCGEAINKGEKQITRTGVESGEGFCRMHFHLECEEYSRDWDNMDWESHTSGAISRKEVLASFYPPNA